MKTYETLALIVICDRLWLNVNTMVFPDFVTEYFYFIGEASLTTKRNKCEREKKQNVLSSTSVANGASWHLVCWVGVSCGGKLHGRSCPRKGSVTEKSQRRALDMSTHLEPATKNKHIIHNLGDVSNIQCIDSYRKSVTESQLVFWPQVHVEGFFFCTYYGPIARESYCTLPKKI